MYLVFRAKSMVLNVSHFLLHESRKFHGYTSPIKLWTQDTKVWWWKGNPGQWRLDDVSAAQCEPEYRNQIHGRSGGILPRLAAWQPTWALDTNCKMWMDVNMNVTSNLILYMFNAIAMLWNPNVYFFQMLCFVKFLTAQIFPQQKCCFCGQCSWWHFQQDHFCWCAPRTLSHSKIKCLLVAL